MNYHSLCFSIFCFLVFTSIVHHPCCAYTGNVTKLVQQVCAKTSNYTFCVEALYSDPHTPGADEIFLVDIAFRLAYANASSTQKQISELLKKNGTSRQYHQSLQRCARDYKKGLFAIGEAFSDMNSENYDSLARYAGVAARAATDCESSFRGTDSPLTLQNNALKGLLEICIVISNLISHPPV